MHWAIPTSAWFLLKNIFMETCFCSFLVNFIQFIMRCCPLTSGWCVILTIVQLCTDEWGPTASTLCPLCWLPRKKVQAVSSSYAQKLKSHYGARLAEERKKERRWIIIILMVCHFKIVTTSVHCYYYCRPGQAVSAILCTFQCLQIKILKIP